MESLRTPETEQYHFFRSVCLFSCEKSLCYFQYFNFRYSSNVTFQHFDALKFVKRLCTAFKNFHVKNVCTGVIQELMTMDPYLGKYNETRLYLMCNMWTHILCIRAEFCAFFMSRFDAMLI